MNPEEFEKQMENLKKPEVAEVKPPFEIKLAIISANRSAAIGLWFVVVPCFLIAGAVMKYMFMVNIGLIDTLEEMMASMGRGSGMEWIQPVLLFGLPIVAIIVNALAITHFKWKPETTSMVITLKMRWFNILILIVSVMIVCIFLLYLVTENMQARPGH